LNSKAKASDVVLNQAGEGEEPREKILELTGSRQDTGKALKGRGGIPMRL
jgi:hypothetical protein